MEIITGSGDVDVENLEGGLQVTSGSGNIGTSGKAVSDWQADTGAGMVRVIFPADSNLALIAHPSPAPSLRTTMRSLCAEPGTLTNFAARSARADPVSI